MRIAPQAALFALLLLPAGCNASRAKDTAPDATTTSSAEVKDAGVQAPLQTACKKDADCRNWSSYCRNSPCSCFAISTAMGDPGCTGAPISCVVDPCQGKVAACQDGKCVSMIAPPR